MDYRVMFAIIQHPLHKLKITSLPAVTSLKFKDSMVMGVGTSNGQMLQYNIRSDKPFTLKHHQYGKEIKKMAFHPYQGHYLVVSMDSRVLRYWDKDTGKPFCSIEAKADFNDFCLVPDTCMMFLAKKDMKMLENHQKFFDSLGLAPSWCSFLDNLTKELEKTNVTSVYDDYKFVTAKDLDEPGLSQLIGNEMLRAYMHGYFMDLTLYKKTKSLVDPFSIERFKKKKIGEKIDEERANRVQVREFFNFTRCRLLNPVVSRLDKQREKKLRKELITEENELPIGSMSFFAALHFFLLDAGFADTFAYTVKQSEDLQCA
ncbi:hypothetical protein QYM36_019260 [Artemia franciscana]|uniref:Nucleolar protein 10 n=1 Tax=Artemia franciscana TaxID=6661 RepID=A0AA88H1G0_ARTSF|nr:hypothetical protein QYM36_019260 [Artemia franciscana]